MSPKTLKKKPTHILYDLLNTIEDIIFDSVINKISDDISSLIHQREIIIHELEERRFFS